MSEIKVDTLTGKTTAGDITVTSEGGAATMQLQQGLAKAWMSLNASATPVAIRDSFNISSVTDALVGSQEPSVTNVFSSVDSMAPTAGSWNNLDSSGKYGNAAGVSSSSKYWVGSFWSGTNYDVIYNLSTVHGDLA
jgi:hypothetical protein